MKMMAKGLYKADWTRVMGGEKMYECFHCGEKAVVWDNDFSFGDYQYDGDGIVHACHCTNCGALITYMVPFGDNDDEETLEDKD